MVRSVADKTGRFSQRPHYQPAELDRECEAIITTFLRERHGDAVFPVSTEDITVLIEREVESLDQFADLSKYGPKVEGLTHFQPGGKPIVMISDRLSSDDNRENRLRTTLTHEYGHVHFHAYLWDLEPPSSDLLKRNPSASMQICYRDTMLEAGHSDWMEWQAGYVCGALLMPASRIRQVASQHVEGHGIYGTIGVGDSHATTLIEKVAVAFQVSAEAARIRLTKLGILGASSAGPSLFDLKP